MNEIQSKVMKYRDLFLTGVTLWPRLIYIFLTFLLGLFSYLIFIKNQNGLVSFNTLKLIICPGGILLFFILGLFSYLKLLQKQQRRDKEFYNDISNKIIAEDFLKEEIISKTFEFIGERYYYFYITDSYLFAVSDGGHSPVLINLNKVNELNVSYVKTFGFDAIRSVVVSHMSITEDIETSYLMGLSSSKWGNYNNEVSEIIELIKKNSGRYTETGKN